MNLSRRQFHQLLLASLAVAMPGLSTGSDPVQGGLWEPIDPPQPGSKPGKIEVIEFFAYGCPHCRDLNPRLKTWAAGLPSDVYFRRVPVTFGRAAWTTLARLFYALEALGELERLDEAVFNALHAEHANLFSEEAVTEWAVKQGINGARFTEVFHSFEVEVALKRAETLSRTYAINGVPTLTVAGRYRVLSSGIKGWQDLFDTTDQLIARTRAEAGRS